MGNRASRRPLRAEEPYVGQPYMQGSYAAAPMMMPAPPIAPMAPITPMPASFMNPQMMCPGYMPQQQPFVQILPPQQVPGQCQPCQPPWQFQPVIPPTTSQAGFHPNMPQPQMADWHQQQQQQPQILMQPQMAPMMSMPFGQMQMPMSLPSMPMQMPSMQPIFEPYGIQAASMPGTPFAQTPKTVSMDYGSWAGPQIQPQQQRVQKVKVTNYPTVSRPQQQ